MPNQQTFNALDRRLNILSMRVPYSRYALKNSRAHAWVDRAHASRVNILRNFECQLRSGAVTDENRIRKIVRFECSNGVSNILTASLIKNGSIGLTRNPRALASFAQVEANGS